MICYCICDFNHKEQLEEDLFKKFNGYTFDVRKSANEIINLITEGDVVVLEHEKVCECKENLKDILNFLYVYYDGRIFSVKEEQDYLKIKEQMLDEKNWNGVKKINDRLLDFDFLKKRTKSIGLPDYIQIETTN